MMASINSEHVVTVYQAQIIDGQPTLEMEFMEGGALDRALEQGLPLAEAVAVVQQLLAGLQDIHAAGLVHRDIKPGNVLSNGRGRYKIADFGISVVSGNRPTLRAGTTQYVAPEVLRPPHHFDQRADLYGAGMTAYEIILGAPRFREVFAELFEGGGPAADHRWFNWACDPEVEATPLMTLVPGVPVGISEVVRRLMAKDPAQRLATAGEALVVLSGAQRGATRALPSLDGAAEARPLWRPSQAPPGAGQFPGAPAPAGPPPKAPAAAGKGKGGLSATLLAGGAVSFLIGVIVLITIGVIVLMLVRSSPMDVKVDTEPSGAWLVRGERRDRTPYTFQQLEPGSKQEVTFKRPGFEDRTATLEVASGETTQRFGLKPLCVKAPEDVVPLRVRPEGLDLASEDQLAELQFAKVVGPGCDADVIVKRADEATSVTDGAGKAFVQPIRSTGEAAIGEVIKCVQGRYIQARLMARARQGAPGMEVQVATREPRPRSIGCDLDQASGPVPKGSFRVGEDLAYWARSAHQRLAVLDLTPHGEIFVVFPFSVKAFLETTEYRGCDSVTPGRWIAFPPGQVDSKVDPPAGRDVVIGISFDSAAAVGQLESDYAGVWSPPTNGNNRRYAGDEARAFAEKLAERMSGPGWSGAVATFDIVQ